MNHVHAGHFTYGQITGACIPKELDGILRFSGASGNRVSIEKIGDVGMRHELEKKPGVDASCAVVDPKVDQLIVEITIENDDIGVGRLSRFRDREFHADRIDEAENHAHGDGERILNILVAPIDGLVGSADTDLSSKDNMAEGFTQPAHGGDVIPKSD